MLLNTHFRYSILSAMTKSVILRGSLKTTESIIVIDKWRDDVRPSQIRTDKAT